MASMASMRRLTHIKNSAERLIVIEIFPGFKPPITRLFDLANTSLDPQTFRRGCEEFATFDPSSSDDDLWYFSLSGGPTLIVGLQTEPTGRKKPNGWPEYRQLAVSCAILSICWWESFLKSDHKTLESWKAERAEFDRFFAQSLAVAQAALGPARLHGADADEHGHKHAIWFGKSGLLILQQSAYDPQFGLDVNYWIRPWREGQPQPTSPLIDWLSSATGSNV
jgi:hypothetical protein